MTPADFVAKFGESPSRSALNMMVAQGAEQLLLFFPNEDMNTKACEALVQKMIEMGCRRSIIVYSGRFTSQSKQVLDLVSATCTVEHFRDEELLIDITEHELVPQHTVLAPAEKKQLLEKYKLQESQLPRMQVGDPVARYFGMTRGQVVKITRPSETAGRYQTYRVVA